MAKRKIKSGDIPSRRRDPKAQVGFVNFPSADTFPSTGEGGEFVRLVVLDTKGDDEYMHRYVPCCGGYVSFGMDETFLGDDTFDEKVKALGPEPAWDNRPEASNQKWRRFNNRVEKLSRETEERYFPRINDENRDLPDLYESRPFLAVFLLGATGWSGSWRCQFKDLTREGKALYRMVGKLYPGCELRLLTFLDT